MNTTVGVTFFIACMLIAFLVGKEYAQSQQASSEVYLAWTDACNRQDASVRYLTEQLARYQQIWETKK